MSEEKIGMYSTKEIYEELANGFLHHSMVDAMYFKIKDLQQKVEQLENIRKEIKEYIEKNFVCCKNSDMLVELNVYDLLNILNKGSESNELD